MECLATRLQREARLIESLRTVVQRYVGTDTVAADAALSALGKHLRRQIQIEEHSLFPAIEERVGDPHFEPTRRMRREHRVILDLLGGIERGLAANNLDAVCGDLCELGAALRAHVEEETRVIGPLIRSSDEVPTKHS